VNIWTPQQVSAEEKSMLDKLNDSDNFKPHPDKSEKSFFEKVREIFS
jgi:molecular chaperone DnaJ